MPAVNTETPFSPSAIAAFDTSPVATDHLLSIFLNRLRRLIEHRIQHADALNPEGIHLLDHAIFSTYCDCRRLGGQAVAQGLVQSGLRQAPAGRTLSTIA